MQKGVTSEEAGQVTMSTRGLPVIARQFHERLSIAEMQSRDPEPMRFLVKLSAANEKVTNYLHSAERSVNSMPERRADNNAKIYLVGGGIASLAAAAFLIRDGDIPGHNITILE